MVPKVSLKQETLCSLVGGCSDLEEIVALIFKVKMKMETEGSYEILATSYQFA